MDIFKEKRIISRLSSNSGEQVIKYLNVNKAVEFILPKNHILDCIVTNNDTEGEVYVNLGVTPNGSEILINSRIYGLGYNYGTTTLEINYTGSFAEDTTLYLSPTVSWDPQVIVTMYLITKKIV